MADVATTLVELEARIAALEAGQAELKAQRVDYQAVLSAINALGANQREHAERLSRLESTQAEHTATLAQHTGYLRSLDDGQAEIKDLLIRALGDGR
jgi:uncharacterized protein involved in type VI secretion and phage assembly